jgi:hypothetical protein
MKGRERILDIARELGLIALAPTNGLPSLARSSRWKQATHNHQVLPRYPSIVGVRRAPSLPPRQRPACYRIAPAFRLAMVNRPIRGVDPPRPHTARDSNMPHLKFFRSRISVARKQPLWSPSTTSAFEPSRRR